MDERVERRCMERVYIPVAKLYYRLDGRHSLLNTYHGPYPISDISKSSLCVNGVIGQERKALVSLKLVVPDVPEILLKGYILKFLADPSGSPVKTIIQLMPYGYEPRYNSFKYKKRLEHCLDTYI